MNIHLENNNLFRVRNNKLPLRSYLDFHSQSQKNAIFCFHSFCKWKMSGFMLIFPSEICIHDWSGVVVLRVIAASTTTNNWLLTIFHAVLVWCTSLHFIMRSKTHSILPVIMPFGRVKRCFQLHNSKLNKTSIHFFFAHIRFDLNFLSLFLSICNGMTAAQWIQFQSKINIRNMLEHQFLSILVGSFFCWCSLFDVNICKNCSSKSFDFPFKRKSGKREKRRKGTQQSFKWKLTFEKLRFLIEIRELVEANNVWSRKWNCCTISSIRTICVRLAQVQCLFTKDVAL
jgi:hypothetical protein